MRSSCPRCGWVRPLPPDTPMRSCPCGWVDEGAGMTVTDPPIRVGGRCACGCGKNLKRSKEARRYAGDLVDADPFFSAECCRRFHGVRWAADEVSNERMRRGGEAAADRYRSEQWVDHGSANR